MKKGESMGTWHLNPECERALIKLDDALCSFERATEREYTLILVPHSSDEKIFMSQNGKPLPQDFDMTTEQILSMAMEARRKT